MKLVRGSSITLPENGLERLAALRARDRSVHRIERIELAQPAEGEPPGRVEIQQPRDEDVRHAFASMTPLKMNVAGPELLPLLIMNPVPPLKAMPVGAPGTLTTSGTTAPVPV